MVAGVVVPPKLELGNQDLIKPQQQKDQIDRDNLKYAVGYYVLTLRDDEDWQSKLELLASLV